MSNNKLTNQMVPTLSNVLYQTEISLLRSRPIKSTDSINRAH